MNERAITGTDDEVLTAPQVASWLQLSVETVRRLTRRGKLRAIAGPGQLRFARAHVRAFIHGE